jgi:hypothetical protein
LKAKMNILILGCSFGVPNYGGSGTGLQEHHTEFLLLDRGHVVHNCSQNAGSNLNTLERANRYLSGLPIVHPACEIGNANKYQNQFIECKNIEPLDLIIWFHTELSRDGRYANTVYSKFAEFFSTHNAKVAVIGGAGDVLPEFLTMYTPDFFIPSWRRLILGKDVPLSNTLSDARSIDNSTLPLIEKLKIVEDNLTLIELVNQSPHFFDGCHPGQWPHQDLVDRLIGAKLIT